MGNHNSGGAGKKTVAEHKLAGTYRADRHGGIELPKADQAKPKPEAHITSSKVPTKASVYKRFVTTIYGEGVCSSDDGVLISQLAELYVAYCMCSQLIEEEGVQAKVGSKSAITMSMEIGKEIRAILGEFHLTPSSRRKAGKGDETIMPDPLEDKVGAFLSKPRLVE